MSRQKSNRIIIVLVAIYRFIIRQFKDPAFGVALALSTIMWLLYTLSGDFTTVISVPIRVEGVVNKTSGDLDVEKSDNEFTIDCKVSGKGFNILYYSLLSDIVINTADVKIIKSENNEYVIDIPSLESKMNEKLRGVTLINIFQKRLSFKTLTYSSKIVPIELNIDIENDGQFMQIGDIIIDPSNLSVSGNLSKLDSIQSIRTNYLHIENRDLNISGEIELEKIPGTEYSHSKVYYSINFQRYTEKKILKKIQLKNSENERYIIIPSQVEVVLNVAENIYADFNHFNFPLYVDLKDRKEESSESTYMGDNKFILKYRQLPKGVNVRIINPKYVTILKGGTEGDRTAIEQPNRKTIYEIINRENEQ